jgi:hypothetical protein
MQRLVTITNAIPDKRAAAAVTKALRGVYDRLSSILFTTGGLAIKAGGGTLVKAGTLCKAVAGGVLFSIAANTDAAALVGTVTNAKFNVFAFFAGSDGTIHSSMGTEGAALVNVVFPTIMENHAIIGFVIINPTGTGDFVGGTTALDDSTVVPNAVYVNTVGPFNPTATI